jgi:hypothetical protein
MEELRKINPKRCGSKRLWPMLRYYKYVSGDTDENHETPLPPNLIYEARLLISRSRRSVTVVTLNGC